MAVHWRRAFSLLMGLMLVASCSSSSGVRTLGADTIAPFPTEPAGAPTTTIEPTPVADDHGIGDELFPALGSPGIDVQHYDLDLRYDADTGRLGATAVVDLSLVGRRSEIGLDAVGLDVEQVAVDGVETGFRVGDDELRITLPSPGEAGDDLTVRIEYAVDVAPEQSPVGLPVGWFATEGGSYVLNEPDGARTWLPCNDHPSDKATYDISITTPVGVTGVANGLLVDHRTEGAVEVWHWRERTPMATYLLLVLTGDYELVEGIGPGGLPLQSAVLRDDRTVMQPFLDTIDDQIAWFEQWFGPYPLSGYGLAITDSDPGLAMETQGRSLFSRGDFLGGELDYTTQMLLSHELAHQWFGDAVTPARWTDIWLNESFATYGEWMWLDHVGIDPLDAAADRALQGRPPGSTARPSVDQMFGYNSYSGGAVVLHALRLTVGDTAFFQMLRDWVQSNIGDSRTTDDFVALAERVSGRSLTAFFDSWLFAEQLPLQYPDVVGA